jgi:hypothetical protein
MHHAVTLFYVDTLHEFYQSIFRNLQNGQTAQGYQNASCLRRGRRLTLVTSLDLFTSGS